MWVILTPERNLKDTHSQQGLNECHFLPNICVELDFYLKRKQENQFQIYLFIPVASLRYC